MIDNRRIIKQAIGLVNLTAIYIVTQVNDWKILNVKSQLRWREFFFKEKNYSYSLLLCKELVKFSKIKFIRRIVLAPRYFTYPCSGRLVLDKDLWQALVHGPYRDGKSRPYGWDRKFANHPPMLFGVNPISLVYI